MTLIETVRSFAPYLESWVEYQRDMGRIPGVQVAIRVGDELAASFALGHANEPKGEKLTTRHLFRIASHSKTFTATAIMQLVEAGKLRLDDTAGQYIPELQGSAAQDYTVRELLGHQSGINRDGADSEYWQQRFDFPDRAKVIELCRADAVFERNHHFKYTNMGYSLLGLIIEAASGQSYEDYIAEHITGPLGVKNLGPELPAEREGELATGHSALMHGHDMRRTLPSSNTHAMAAATGFFGTAEDLTAYWARHALGQTTLISDASKRLMQRKESEVTRPTRRWYGLGLIIDDLGGRPLVGHSGGFPGHITQSWLDPKTGLSVSVLTNTLGGPATEWATNIVKLIDFAQKKPEKQRADAPGIDPNTFTGRFATSWGVYDIVNLNGRLVALFPQGDPAMTATELTIVDADTLAPEPEAGFGSVGEPYTFGRDEKGQIEWVRSGGSRAWPVEKYREMLAAQQ
ncbi:serine hydrolase domain-containing protein [Deinococcus fonticola]|uniref:serine hydrolase domain-containing protein n=1 Tax=Deinococcus fonticola TaxID=2528713 RepID=UPI0010752529|nr:serine hydrolase domain-containing protein [Deinococcus fonticola]